MADDNNAQLELLRSKMAEFEGTLSVEQKELLGAILDLAWDISAEEDAPEFGFDGCFNPEEAELVTNYSKGPLVMWPKMIRAMIRSPHS